MKIIFLSFSKCAGTAIKNAIKRNHPNLRKLPAWDKHEIGQFTIRDLNEYDFFAGHFDWANLDCVAGERFVFTVLRQPFDRIVSEYCYAREKAMMEAEKGRQFSLPHERGQHLIRTLSPLEFFRLRNTEKRDIVHEQFDNVYTYFFFHRRYDGERFARARHIPRPRVLKMALENLALIDYVATFDTLQDDLREIERLTELRFSHDVAVEHQTSFGAGQHKRDLTYHLDPTGELVSLFEEFSSLDAMLYEMARVHTAHRRQLVPRTHVPSATSPALA